MCKKKKLLTAKKQQRCNHGHRPYNFSLRGLSFLAIIVRTAKQPISASSRIAETIDSANPAFCKAQ